MSQQRIKNILSSQLRLNMLSGFISTGLSVVVSAVKYPLYLHYLGYNQYGTWLLLATILTFAQMGLLGITPAITKLVAEEYGRNNHKTIQTYFSTALSLLIVVGTLIIGILLLFKWEIIALLGLEHEETILIGSLFAYMLIFSVGVLMYQVLNSLLAGIGRIDISNYSQTLLQLLPLVVSIPLLMAGQGIVSLLAANAFSYSLVFLFNFIQLNRIIRVHLLKFNYFSWLHLQKMLTFGFPVFSGAMLNMTVIPITKVVITRSMGLEVVPVFELVYRVGMQMRSVFEVALRALMPEISKLSAQEYQKNDIKIQHIVSKAYLLLFWGATPLYAIIFMLADTIFKIWLGDNFNALIPDAFRTMIFVISVSLAGVIPYYTALGQGATKRIFTHHILCTSGTLFTLGIIINVIPNIDLISIIWCFFVGAFLGTGYLYSPQQLKKVR